MSERPEKKQRLLSEETDLTDRTREMLSYAAEHKLLVYATHAIIFIRFEVSLGVKVGYVEEHDSGRCPMSYTVKGELDQNYCRGPITELYVNDKEDGKRLGDLSGDHMEEWHDMEGLWGTVMEGYVEPASFASRLDFARALEDYTDRVAQGTLEERASEPLGMQWAMTITAAHCREVLK